MVKLNYTGRLGCWADKQEQTTWIITRTPRCAHFARRQKASSGGHIYRQIRLRLSISFLISIKPLSCHRPFPLAALNWIRICCYKLLAAPSDSIHVVRLNYRAAEFICFPTARRHTHTLLFHSISLFSNLSLASTKARPSHLLISISPTLAITDTHRGDPRGPKISQWEILEAPISVWGGHGFDCASFPLFAPKSKRLKAAC